MKKKILLFAILICSAFCIYTAFSDIKSVIGYVDVIDSVPENSYELYRFYMRLYLIKSVFDILIFSVLICSFAFIVKNADHAIRYTYEEYKAIRDARKADKKARKKEKLQKQLDQMNAQD